MKENKDFITCIKDRHPVIFVAYCCECGTKFTEKDLKELFKMLEKTNPKNVRSG